MLFKGTRNYPTARLISEAIEGVGGTFNASTGKEVTSYTARVPGEELPAVMTVLADMVRYSLFDPAEIEKERSVIIEELSATRDDPQEWVNLLVDETMWPALPLGRDDAGTIESVSGLQRSDMLAYLDTYYRPNSLVISVAGNVQHEQVLELVQHLFGDWQQREIPSYAESLPPRNASPVRIIEKDTEQTNVCIATLGTAYGSPDYYPLLLINAILGDGMSSRLFQSVREEQGLAYDIGSYLNSYAETGSFVISAGVDPSQTEGVVRAISAELRRLTETPVPADELKRIKAYVRGGILLGLEGTQQVASWLGGQECLQNNVRDIDEMVALVDAVTVPDILRVARTCFAPEWRRLALIGPGNTYQTNNIKKLLINE